MGGKRKPKISPQRQAILDQLADEETVIFFEPEVYDQAIIGLSAYQPGRPRCVVYRYDGILEATFTLLKGCNREEAEEWVEVNTLGAWLGEATPIVLERQHG